MSKPDEKPAAPNLHFMQCNLWRQLGEMIENRAKLHEDERERFEKLEFKDGEKIKIVRPRPYELNGK